MLFFIYLVDLNIQQRIYTKKIKKIQLYMDSSESVGAKCEIPNHAFVQIYLLLKLAKHQILMPHFSSFIGEYCRI
jgi:hypothetical protein